MKPALGVCYYPEQWPREMWATDAARMAETGLAYVRIGEFAWNRIEPEPGRIELGWLVEVMDLLHANRLKVVLGTPTAAPPRWMIARHPDMLLVDSENRVRKFGSRRNYCPSHIGYREEGARITRALAERVKGHPALALWQTDNEYACHYSAMSFSPAALAAFRLWLAEKYRTVDALNLAWGNVFWSMEYRSFGEIDLPNLTQYDASPTHWLDFRRFSSDQIVAFNKAQVDVLREVTPGVPITHNYMGESTGFDHFRIGQDMEIASWYSYPLGRIQNREGISPRKQAYARQGDPDMQAFHADLYRAVGKGRVWIMEQQPGPVNWAAHNADPLPGMARLWAWEAFAHGTEVVSYFRWRQAPFAQEQMHAGLLRPDNEPAPALAEAAQVAREIQQIPTPVVESADCAIVFDYESAWAWDIQPQSAGFSHFDAVFAQYRQLRKLGLNVDILPPHTKDLTRYKLVFVPALFAWNESLKTALLHFDGISAIGPRTGSKTENFHIPAGLAPDLPANLLNLKVARVESLAPDVTVPLKGGGTIVGWREKIEGSAETLLESEDGWPVLARQGRMHYLAGTPDETAHKRITRSLVDAAGLATHDLPDGLRTRRAGDALFIFNYGLQTRDLPALGFEGPFELDGAVLGPGGVAIGRC
ncbi:MAG TPA: beta-galactosidase [Arsenicitalea sp.]|nr:beta-galactosidase [Arsenicitalea sp.]